MPVVLAQTAVAVQATSPDDYVYAYNYKPTDVPVTAAQTFVKINGNPILVHGDSVATHKLIPSPYTVHGGATMDTTQTYVKINGKAVVINNDPATCGHNLVTVTQNFVTIG